MQKRRFSIENIFIAALMFFMAFQLSGQGVINDGAKIKIENGTTFVISDATSGDLTNTGGIISNYGDLLIESDLVNNDTLINGSDATGEGRIKIDGIVSGTGLSIAERYYANQSNDGSKPDGRWWYITPGVEDAISDNILDADFPRIWTFSESSNVWNQITTDISLTDLQGYATRVGSDQTVQYHGAAFFDGSLNYAITNSGNGWNLVGNPYPTTIDIDAVLERNSSLVFETAWIRTNLQYATWNSASDLGSNGGSQYVSKMQAFWVLCETAGSFSFEDSDKNTQTVSLLKSTTYEDDATLRIVVSNNDIGDEAIFAVREGAAEYFESFDTQKKFGSANAEIYFELQSGEKLTANVVDILRDSSSYKLGIQTREAGSFRFNFKSIEGFSEEIEIYLEDLENGAFELVSEGMNYEFEIEETSNADRFRLSFFLKSVTSAYLSEALKSPRVSANKQSIYIYTGDIGREQLNVTLYDLQGRQLQRHILEGSDRYTLIADQLPGIYLVAFSAGEKHFTDKIVLSK